MPKTTTSAAAKLSNRQIRSLKKLAHHLNPVLRAGDAGASESFLAELEIALSHHELLKVRIAAEDKASCLEVIDEMCNVTKATLVQRVGHTAVLYRENPDKKAFAARLKG